MHPDLAVSAKAAPANSDDTASRIAPRFIVSRQEAPRYVIILENSAAMNKDNTWDLVIILTVTA
jgi:hypothetical protein